MTITTVITTVITQVKLVSTSTFTSGDRTYQRYHVRDGWNC